MATHQATFIAADRTIVVEVDEDTYLLDAATSAGLELPYMCLQGWCTTCAARLLEGRIDQSESRRYYPQDQAAGFILLCTGRARSDVRILTQQKEEMRAHRRALGLPAPHG